MGTSAFATAFPTTAPTTPNSSTSIKRRMPPPTTPTWPEYNAPVSMLHQHHQQTLHQQPSFKRVRLSHNSPGEFCLQRDLKSLSHSHQWTYQPDHGNNGCWVYEQDSKIRLYKAGGDSNLVLEFSQDSKITIRIPRMYPHETPSVTNIQGLWMDSILIRSLQPSRGGSCFHHHHQTSNYYNNKTVVFDHWSPVVNLSTLLEFCITHAKMHPTSCSHAKMPSPSPHNNNEYCLGERSTNTLHHQHHQQKRYRAPSNHDSENSNSNKMNGMMMEVSHPYKYTSPFAPNRFDVGYNKPQHQDAMEM